MARDALLFSNVPHVGKSLLPDTEKAATFGPRFILQKHLQRSYCNATHGCNMFSRRVVCEGRLWLRPDSLICSYTAIIDMNSSVLHM